ncbi:phosphoenolpyruvate carboxylase 2 [Capsaspora owczarzaki ATCC 30864]|uniref:Phosphoenolpyruvate carboxylase 2 n=1 Tax=Capsaspora owczarzaki (strain ATCC 30864) TaxID=595528 RepID=A0A0D2WNV1_CAPO3|nr:phosphoenolpyruvate carboxylase 2 [Capsaspora owczarzaki ATCC 30864]
MFRLAGLATSVSCKRGLTFTTIAAAARSDKSSMRLFAHSSTATQTQAQTHPQAHHTQNDDNFQDKSAPLRADIKLLGRALGDTIRARDGQATLDRVEELRALSKAWRRNGTGESFDALVAAVHRLDATQMHSVARAFSHFLALANTAEQHHRERRRRSARIQEAAAHAPPPNPLSTPTGFGASAPAKALEGAQPGMLNSTTAAGVLRELTQGSAPGFDQPAPVVVDANAVFETLCDSTVELVFTAHPTQVHRRTTQRIFVSVAAALAQRDRTELPEEIAAAEDDLRRQVALLWTSDEVRREKPTPVDEAIAGLHVAEQVLWEAVPRYLRSLSLRMEQLLGRPLPHHLSLFKFGSWLGSDRDGNAFVTPDVTRDVILRGRWMAAELFYHDVDALYYELSVTSCNEALQRHIGKQTVAEPYREVLRVLREKLRLTRDLARQQLQSLGQSSILTHGGAYSPHPAETATQAGSLPASSSSRSDASPSLVTCSNDILEPLELCYSSLVDVGLANVAQGRLLDTLRRVRVFGSALFHWDIRQESTQHAKALDAITRYLRLPVSYGKMTEAERVAFLTAELESSRPLIPFAFTRDPAILAWLREQFPEDANMIVDVIDTFQMISEQHPEVLNAYVISMTRDPSDVLAVYLLQKAANVRVPCRVVPLFETVNDLDNCVGVMRRLLDNRAYRRIVNGFQEIMIGYSDSAKSAGRVAANWAIFKAQQGLVTLFEDANVRLRLFHGRYVSMGLV